MSLLYRAVVTVMIILMATDVVAQAPIGKQAKLHIRHTEEFEVTGAGNDPAWNKTGWTTLSRIKGSSAYETRIKLLYSDKGLYALFHCEDRQISATLQEDFASLWREDVIEMFLWPDESLPLYLEYELSPHNFELVIMITQIDGKTSGWMPWNYRGEKKTRKGTRIIRDDQENITAWSGEFFIPYTLLRPLRNVPPLKGTEWRANFYRIDYDEAESAYWSWQPVNNNFHEFQKYGTIVFD